MAIIRTWLARLTLGVSAILVAWVAGLILYGVGARYFLGASPIWFDEVSRYSIIASALVGAGAVWVEGGHMRVAIVETRVPAPIRNAIVAYQWLLTVALSGAMTWFSYEYVGQVSFFRTQGLQISRAYPVAILPIGFGLLCLLALLHGPRPIPRPAAETDP